MALYDTCWFYWSFYYSSLCHKLRFMSHRSSKSVYRGLFLINSTHIMNMKWTVWVISWCERYRLLNYRCSGYFVISCYSHEWVHWGWWLYGFPAITINFPRYWPFVRGIYRSPVNSPHKGQWRGALMFSFICVWISSWVNNREAGDLRRYHAHYDVIAMEYIEKDIQIYSGCQ